MDSKTFQQLTDDIQNQTHASQQEGTSSDNSLELQASIDINQINLNDVILTEQDIPQGVEVYTTSNSMTCWLDKEGRMVCRYP